jgi:hypothetical protein
MKTCHFHDDRPGVGICMRCRVVVCAACCTRIEGVNHCHACLKALGGRREEKRGGGALAAVMAALLLGLAWFALFGLCWAIGGKLAP